MELSSRRFVERLHQARAIPRFRIDTALCRHSEIASQSVKLSFAPGSETRGRSSDDSPHRRSGTVHKIPHTGGAGLRRSNQFVLGSARAC